jgi:hypothetical protein
MKWMKERDLLIAQTMAFVQSVTGKIPEAEATVVASVAAAPATKVETARVEASAPVDVVPLQVETPTDAYVPAVIQISSPVAVSAEMAQEIAKPALLPRPDWREDFQSEIKARVANFRAQQERFSREREAYCTATMAKVHATLREGELPPPPRFVK